jgi:hypothetical protein
MFLKRLGFPEIDAHRYMQEISNTAPEKAGLIFAYVIVFALFIIVPVIYCFLRFQLDDFERPTASQSLYGIEEVKEARENYIKQKQELLKNLLSPVEIILSSDNFTDDNPDDIDVIELGASVSLSDRQNLTLTNDNESAAERDALTPPINILRVGDSEECKSKYIKLVSITIEIPDTGMRRNLERRRVPNECAVCLEEYSVGSKMVWSSNSNCRHAFHSECLMNWLLHERGPPICPCCQQKFVEFNENDFVDQF